MNAGTDVGGMTISGYWQCFSGILRRELLRFVQQRSRFISALVRPLLWLVVFAAGFRAALGIAIIPPYETYITYEIYIMPGLIGMILLFNGMQSALSMVYDREMGSMRILLTSPAPRSFLLVSKLVASALVSMLQVLGFVIVSQFFGMDAPLSGYFWLWPSVFLAALMVGALGLLLSSLIRQLENFAGVMNFVVFPLFFLSSALYPLWKMRESSELIYTICAINPFTHAVELIRFSLYASLNIEALVITLLTTAVLLLAAIVGYDPKRGMMVRKANAG